MIRFLKNVLVFVIGLLAGRKTASEPPDLIEPAPRPGWKLFFKRLALLVPVLAVGGFLLAASGIMPIKASSGHWAITAWFLEFSMSRSIATHTIGMAAPPLDDRALVVKGAGHYETGCRPCHGGVDFQPEIPRHMTPQPPHLPPEISKWEPEELFYIVKHGIKFTGMPAWPALQREDEVWAVVAFLLRLPDLDVAEYRRLVRGETTLEREVDPGSTDDDTAGVTILDLGPGALRGGEITGVPDIPGTVEESCGRCHGLRGEGREVSAFPRLAGQQPDYLYAALRAYSHGERYSGMMEPIAAGLTDDEMREAARYFAASDARPRLVEGAAQASETDAVGTSPVEPSPQEGPGSSPETADGRESGSRPGRGSGSSLETADGREIAYLGLPNRKVPSCVDCHGPVGRRRNPYYPVLAGQYADYIVLQLELFKERRRGGSAFAQLMHAAVSRMTADEMREVARFYESLGEEAP